MRILIVSDTHGRDKNLEYVLKREGKIDAFIHLGDLEGSEEYLPYQISCPCYMVAGNNDFYTKLNRELIAELGKYKVMMTHGHEYVLYLGTDRLAYAGLSREVDIVMFGHTHCPLVEKRENITLINPGSLSLPRQEGRRPSYIIMTIDEDGEADYEIKYL